MSLYILQRFLLMIPTLFGVMFITFVITQFVPGGPVEKIMAQIEGRGTAGEAGGGTLWIGIRANRALIRNVLSSLKSSTAW